MTARDALNQSIHDTVRALTDEVLMPGPSVSRLAGLVAAGLRDDRLELTRAVSIALENPDAAARWLAGESVFAAAYLR